MKKRNFAVRLGIAAMALTLITTSLSSGTLAKYTETYTATGTLKVAKWNVGAQINGEPMTTAGVTLSSMLGTGANNGAGYSGVKSGTVAPGMTGKIVIDVSAAGASASDSLVTEVDVFYEVYVNAPNGVGALPKNLKFKANDGSSSDTEVILNSDSVEKNGGKGEKLTSGTIPFATAQTGWGKYTANVTWEWPWESASTSNKSGDEWDLTAGNTAGSTEIVFTVVFTQVDPTGSKRHDQAV